MYNLSRTHTVVVCIKLCNPDFATSGRSWVCEKGQVGREMQRCHHGLHAGVCNKLSIWLDKKY